MDYFSPQISFLRQALLNPMFAEMETNTRKMSLFPEVTGPVTVKAELICKSDLTHSVSHFLLYLGSFCYPHLDSIGRATELFFQIYLFLFYVYGCFYLHVCLLTMCMCTVPLELSEPLELQLQTAVGFHVGTGNRTQVFL